MCFWQKKAWVDRDVMLDIAKIFVKFKKEKHGDDAILLFADNLDAHCYELVLEVFSQANILIWLIVPGCTDLIQPIDAGIGRSIRIYVGHVLDRWLSIDDNLDEWEEKLSASDRQVMMTNFLSSAMNQMLFKEKNQSMLVPFVELDASLSKTTDSSKKQMGIFSSVMIISNHRDLRANIMFHHVQDMLEWESELKKLRYLKHKKMQVLLI